jgi:GH24 family phage-related lysozyme (muramidase)
MSVDQRPLTDLGFRGNPEWVHSLEGHAGRPYWPGGQSGVTLDPGVDLGHADESLVVRCYDDLLAPTEMQACLRAKGITGKKARRRVEQSSPLQAIRISEEEAAGVFPLVAKPYWVAAKRRWPELMKAFVPGAVHTVVLSLCYNRGPGNPALKAIGEPLRACDWQALADVIADMQDDHQLVGIQQRRDKEGEYIRRHARRQKMQRLAEGARAIEAAEEAPLPDPTFDVPMDLA